MLENGEEEVVGGGALAGLHQHAEHVLRLLELKLDVVQPVDDVLKVRLRVAVEDVQVDG